MNEVEFLKNILLGLVYDHEEISIDNKVDELGTLLTIKVSQKDMGILIGKNGSTIQALRTIMRMHGLNIGKKIHLKILES